MNLGGSFRYGLMTQSVVSRLARRGLVINPYYLFREGVPRVAPPHPGESFVSEVLRPEDLLEAAACAPYSRNAERFEDRLGRGHVCVVVRDRGTIAGYTWADLEEINDSACDFPLQSGDAYLYDAYIAPEYRGRALAPFMRMRCYEHLSGRGVQRFFSISDYFNTPAIRFKEKLDARRIRLYLQIQVAGRELGQWLVKEYEPP